MKKLLIIMLIGGMFSMNASSQTEEKKQRLLVAVEMLGGYCGSVDSYTEIKGWGGSSGSISIYCSNGANYSLKRDPYSSKGYKLERR